MIARQFGGWAPSSQAIPVLLGVMWMLSQGALGRVWMYVVGHTLRKDY